MASSAFFSSSFQATANNILNKFDNAPIYNTSTGAWSFKNSSGTEVMSVSGSGAVTFPVNTKHTFGNISTANTTDTDMAICANGATWSPYVSFRHNTLASCYVGMENNNRLITAADPGDLCYVTNGKAHVWSVDNGTTAAMSLSSTGAVMMGHINAGVHTFVANASPFLDLRNKLATGSARQMLRFYLGATGPTDGTSCGGISTTDGAASPAFFSGASDYRLKKDIQDAPSGALNRICSVRLRDFRMIEDEPDSPLKRGVIAQELAEVYPDKVHTREDGFLFVSMGYDWEFMQAIQELSAKLDAQAALLEAEKARNDALQTELDTKVSALEARLAELDTKVALLEVRLP